MCGAAGGLGGAMMGSAQAGDSIALLPAVYMVQDGHRNGAGGKLARPLVQLSAASTGSVASFVARVAGGTAELSAVADAQNRGGEVLPIAPVERGLKATLADLTHPGGTVGLDGGVATQGGDAPTVFRARLGLRETARDGDVK